MEYVVRVRCMVCLLVAISAAAWAIPAGAQCTDPGDANRLKKSVRKAARCNDKILRAGPLVTCSIAPPPACSGTVAADVIALAYGANNPATAEVDHGALSDQLKCQKQIGRAVSYYVGSKLRAVIKGQPPDPVEAEAKASRQLDKIPDKCIVNVVQDVSNVVVPSLGPQCAAALPAPGGAVDAATLRDCLHTLLRVWVNRIVPNPPPLRPNIIFILSDDQRWDTTDGTHGLGGAAVMPGTRAELADKGVEFTQAYMTTPLCCPSRSSILSGQYSHRTGVYKNGGINGGADDFNDSSTVATWLMNAGYRTSLMGKYLNGYAGLWQTGQPPYVPPGWTEWHGMKNVAYFNYTIVEPDGQGGYVENNYGSAESDYSTDVLREKAKTFISDSVALGEPFFLYLAFKAPHLPQIPAPRHEGLFQSLLPWRPPSYNEPDVSDKPTWVQNMAPLTPQEQADLDQIRIDQLEMLQAVDEAIGGSATYGIVGIMQHLRNLGIADNTIVIYFSDNGWLWGEHRLEKKNKPYEEAIRAPMFVYYPQLAPLPRKDDRFALNIDIAPTCAELAGATPTSVVEGASLVRVIDDTQPAWRTDFLTEGWPNNHPWATVHEAQWKYTEIPTTVGDPNTTFERELYDLVNDPYEQTNVASDPQYAARIATMAARLRQLRPNWPIDSDPKGPDPDEDE